MDCRICLEKFDPDKVFKQPRILKCGHSFCKKCLDFLLTTKGRPTCAICRTEIKRNANFPINYGIMNLIFKEKKTLKNTCDNNEKHLTHIHYFCMECNQKMCEECVGTKHISKRCGNVDISKLFQDSLQREKRSFNEMINKKTKFPFQFMKSSLVILNLHSVEKTIYKELKDTQTILNEVIENINSCKNLQSYYETAKEFDIEEFESKATLMFEQLSHLSLQYKSKEDSFKLQWVKYLT